ncbi:hypothetical protein PhaeoP75_00140 [Phaeobacter gallaeciensis]|uniref:Uncharacterized protein n=2 Tax=Phaeobacter gallaeciensis TaxID=60890 RepID=A0AAC9Z641_9RHOB|nr:hypothetical protein Gal_00141 [Phaeobacter gallaeciensis DSM 26640]ATE91210.1 hypothetical protein PhaeoP11_00140 [Phaeobacter gallaeciensis]ATE95485.1 hypothetical protein PhaeoP73_00140 [Phaeobacter gallaeciensis]ATE99824.1 hypothetical protein PhaeoP75_00140 [Phaeobacter gallaeciensis]ATF04257.1 hypothetical protein PhaeoP63_00140 [Phaeobacter gallaeciensis]
MPISTALKFCNEFDVELKWLAMGEGPKVKLQQENLVEAVALAVLQMHREKDLNPPAEKVAKQISFVLDQCTAKGTSPIDEARLLIEVL